MMVTKVDTKTFVGKDIIHIAIFDKGTSVPLYLIYRDEIRAFYIKDLMFRVLPEINYILGITNHL
jgi:hypothetical protein